MSLSVYDVTVPVFTRMLGNMSQHLEKAEEFAAKKKFNSANLVSARLAPDMFPLVQQVQIACDTAKMCCSRLTGIEAPKFEDNEKTVEELKARIEKTLAFLRDLPAAKFEGAETRQVTLTLRGEPLQLTGQAYLLGHALPNFYFHYTTTYALLRHNGVDLGKGDYLRGLK